MRFSTGSTFTDYYLATWLLLCLVAVILMVLQRGRLELFQRSYWRMLAQPWKLTTFAISGAFVTLIGPYTTDFTWDWVDGSVMSVLTFVTAPWAVGTLHRFFRGRAPIGHAYIAACLWMFSASWCYDAWMLYREGYYVPTWLPNIVLSSCLYLPAGLFWSLEYREGRGVHFGFTEPHWPAVTSEGAFRRIAVPALVLMAFVAALMLPFIEWPALFAFG